MKIIAEPKPIVYKLELELSEQEMRDLQKACEFINKSLPTPIRVAEYLETSVGECLKSRRRQGYDDEE